MRQPKGIVASAGTKRLWWALLLALLVCGAPARADAGKALVVVGPVDPPRNARTRAYIAEAERVARVVEHAGYRVERLYHPHATWERLRSYARGADLLVYYGHGNGHGWMGYTGPDWINGLCLTDPADSDGVYAGKGVPGGNADDLADLGLGPDCTVALVHSCYAAGSSKFDPQPIDYQTATTRVMSYAQAFFRAGAAYFVAINYVGVAPDYFSRWVSGQPPDMAFLQTMAGRRVRSEPGMFLVEERHRPKPRSPWVSACVSRPVHLASAPHEPTANDDPARATEREADTLGDSTVTAVVADLQQTFEQTDRDWEPPLGRDWDLERGYTRDVSQQNMLLGGPDAESHGPLQAGWRSWQLTRHSLLDAWRQQRNVGALLAKCELRDATIAGRSSQHRSAVSQAEGLGPAAAQYSLLFSACGTNRGVY